MKFLKKLFGTESNSTEKIIEKKIASNDVNLQYDKNSEQSIESIESITKNGLEILNEFFESKSIETINNPFLHPINLDNAIHYKDELLNYFESKGFENNMAIITIAYIWSEFLIKFLDFKLVTNIKAENQSLGLILIHKKNENIFLYPINDIFSLMNGQYLLNQVLNNIRIQLTNQIKNYYSFNEDIENNIQIELKQSVRKGILLEVRSQFAGDEEANEQNAFLAAKIKDENLQNEIMKFYNWYYLPDLDINFQCTMQLIKKEIYERMDKSITAETMMENIFSQMGNE